MSTVSRTAGAAGSITITIRNSAGQLVTPVSVPVVKWYTDAARTLGEVTLAVTGSGSTYTATWTVGQAPAGVATRYLKVTIEVSTGVFDTDADDDVSFVDAGSSIEIVTAADLLTLDEARSALNIPAGDTTQDVELASYISAVSIRIDGLCGPVVIRTVGDEAHDGGVHVIFLRQYPAVTVASVVEYAAAAATVLAAENPGYGGYGEMLTTTTDFAFDAYLSAIYRRSGGNDSRFAPGRSNIRVDYTAGRFANTTTVDARFKQAAAIFLSHLWRFEQGQGTATFGAPSEGLGIPTFGTPNAVRDLLTDQLKGPAIA